jgi:SHS2 domain-containing protein
MKYRELEHTADLAILVSGKDLSQLFANAAYGLFDVMADLTKPLSGARRSIRLRSPDVESLMVDWLNELIYLHDREGEIYNRFDIDFPSMEEISASVEGGRGEGSKLHVKAATFNDLEIREVAEGFEARLVFDV